MAGSDPFSTSAQLREAYLRYLADSHPIHPSQDRLRRLFDAKLREREMFAREPLISAIPSYASVESPDTLFDRNTPPRLHRRLRKLSADAFDPERPLYRHQVEAINRIGSGRNTVVATGTGSGKTEAFLLPILDGCCRLDEAGEAKGVRAILIYPMNALANDQLDRMRGLIGDSGVTFGRYTGQTPRSSKDADAQAHPTAERADREAIRDDPPDLLLTNFAMLEYLLLRPGDSGIFGDPKDGGGPLRWVVLDEAHVYRGAQGIDISLLMRRLQERYGRRLQFVLTSATLGDGGDPDVRGKIARFATGITGGAFTDEDVVLGHKHEAFAGRSERPLSDDQIQLWADADAASLHGAAASADAAQEWLADRVPEVAASPEGRSGSALLFAAMRDLAPVRRMHRALSERPRTVDELTASAFDLASSDEVDDRQRQATRLLLTAASLAIPDHAHAAPLMSVRAHHFFRGLSGASVLLAPDDMGTEVAELFLEDKLADDVRDQTPELPDGDGVATERPLVGLRTCSHCGMPAAAVVRMPDDSWRPPAGLGGDAGRGGKVELLTWFGPDDLRPLGSEEADDAEGADGDDSLFDPNALYLCLEPGCGRCGKGERSACGHATQVRMFRLNADEEGHLSTCPCCRGTKGPFDSVLREFRTGEDAPTAVLAEEVLRDTAADPADVELPAGGRRLLAFSDSRQRAAYFNPYLTRTAAEPAFVQPLLRAVDELADPDDEPPTPRNLIDRALERVVERPIAVLRRTRDEGYDAYEIKPSRQLSDEEESDLRRELGITLFLHLSATGRVRTKLPGLLLAAPDVQVKAREWAALAECAPKLFEDEAIGRDAVRRLFVYLLRRGAVEYHPKNGVNFRTVRGLSEGPELVTVHRGPRESANKHERLQFNAYNDTGGYRKIKIARSGTANIVRAALGIEDINDLAGQSIAQRTLDAIWEWAQEVGLLAGHHGMPGEFRLRAGRVQVRAGDADWHECDRCGGTSILPMNGRCESFGCSGMLRRVDPDERRRRIAEGHLARRYARDPLPIVVREHTAQLDFERGKRIQEEFNAKQVNVLSCSTTFEMGVDVGQLDSVLMRNVPATPSSYIQRAGRAGRRRQGVAHAVTYAQATPHDQHHYFNSPDVVAGHVPVPTVFHGNARLAQRHVNSLLLGRYFADISADDSPRVRWFFPEPGKEAAGGDRPAGLYAGWVAAHRHDLAKAVAAILPEGCPLSAEAAVDASPQGLYDANDEVDSAYSVGYARPYLGYERERAAIRQQADEARVEGGKKLKYASFLGYREMSLERLKDQLADERLIDFLSGRHWLPSYAFPQDQVRLLITNVEAAGGMRLERDRERGISEYAPGSEVIADGRLFASVGVDHQFREPRIRHYRFCEETRRVALGDSEDAVKEAVPQLAKPPLGGQFIEPRGFLTDCQADHDVRNLFRRRPPANTQIFLVGGAADDQFDPAADLPGATTAIERDARLFRANLGQKKRSFVLCQSCGLAWMKKKFDETHQAPTGRTCRGSFKRLALANIFETDVLQVRFPNAATPPVGGDRPFWSTLAAGVALGACRHLSIDPDDLACSYRAQGEGGASGELLLYDEVPGGAGHVEAIRSSLRDVLAAAREVLATCANRNCGPAGSCYACLRSQRNQFEWPYLQRGAPLEWLDAVLASKAGGHAIARSAPASPAPPAAGLEELVTSGTAGSVIQYRLPSGQVLNLRWLAEGDARPPESAIVLLRSPAGPMLGRWRIFPKGGQGSEVKLYEIVVKRTDTGRIDRFDVPAADWPTYLPLAVAEAGDTGSDDGN